MSRLARALAFLIFLVFNQAIAHIDVQKITTPKGIQVWFVEDAHTPVVSMSFSWRGGSAYSSEKKKGATDLAAIILTRGAGPHKAIAFSDLLRDLGVHLDLEVTPDLIQGHLATPLHHAPRAFDLLKMSFEKPRFDQEEVKTTKERMASILDDVLKQPDVIVERALQQALFGHHPYGLRARILPGDLQTIQRADLAQLIQKRAERASLRVAVCGAISKEVLVRLVDDTFASFAEARDLPALARPTWPQNHTLIAEDTAHPQAEVMIYHPGVSVQDPDFIKLGLLNRVLVSSLKGRLPEELREKRGLVYSVSTDVENLDAADIWSISFATESAKAKEAITVVREQLQKIKEEGISAQELQDAQENLIGSLATRLLTSASIANTLHHFMRHGYPVDYLKLREERIRSVSLDDMNAFIRRFIQLDHLLIAAAGANITKELTP
ncbi:MAG: M16 family metallopeptidase [Holosporales bacterium]